LQPAKVGKIIRSLLKLGLRPADIVILTCATIRHSVFFGIDKLAGHPLRYFTGNYDQDGEPIYTGGEMRFTRVARFRGLHSPAVILVGLDLTPGKAIEQRLRIAFIGMTRASLRLNLVHVPPSAPPEYNVIESGT
jgi:hypothetical protein